MQFSTSAVLAFIAAASAAPVERASETFTLLSIRSASPVHFQPISARGQSLWVGGETSTYCPESVQGLDCSKFTNSTTAFGASEGNPTSLGLDTSVPGGQLVYIAPGGAVKYTQAHSGAYPQGSVVQGFKYGSDGSNKNVAPVANGSTGFLACPATAEQKTTGPWQLFADVTDVQVPSGCADDCYGIGTVAGAYTGSPAWQYA